MTELSEKELFDLETERQIKALIRARKREWNRSIKHEKAVAEKAAAQESRIDTAARTAKSRAAKPSFFVRILSAVLF